jgi:hypothetical protein
MKLAEIKAGGGSKGGALISFAIAAAALVAVFVLFLKFWGGGVDLYRTATVLLLTLAIQGLALR